MEHLWTAFCCTIHLALGFMAGWSVRRRGLDSLVLPPPGLSPALLHFERANRDAQPTLIAMPDQFQAAIETLKQSVATLAEQLAKADSAARKAAGSTSAQAAMENAAVKPQPSDCDRADGRRKEDSERRGHAVPEYMALYEHDLSAVSQFERVDCHDLSAAGISFFLERPLDQNDRLVITLGQQVGGVLMAAKVVYSRAIIMRGEDRYRIGCTFERRLRSEEAESLQRLLALAKEVRESGSLRGS